MSKAEKGMHRYTPHRHSRWMQLLMHGACTEMRDAHVHPAEHPAAPRHAPSTLSEPKSHPSPGMTQVLSATCSSLPRGECEGVASPWWEGVEV